MTDSGNSSSAGRLRLKGVKAGKVDKKKSKKTSTLGESTSRTKTKAETTAIHDDRKENLQAETVHGHDRASNFGVAELSSASNREDEDLNKHLKTEAERRHDDQRRKRLEERLKKEGVKSHKQRVEELNKYLSNLSEHHDMPKIGPG